MVMPPRRRPALGIKERFHRWNIMMTACTELSAQHPKLVLAQLVPLSCTIVMAWSFFTPISLEQGLFRMLLYLYLWFFVLGFVGLFGSSMVILYVIEVLEDRPPSFRAAWQGAMGRLPQMLGWMLLSAGIGLFLRWLEALWSRLSPIAGSTVGIVSGIAWTLASYLVLPVIVIEGIGPWEALDRSAAMMKKVWAEEMLGDLGIGLPFLLGALPAVVPIAANGGLWIDPSAPMVTIVSIVTVIYLVGLYSYYLLTEAIYEAVVYRYAIGQPLPEQFFPSAARADDVTA